MAAAVLLATTLTATGGSDGDTAGSRGQDKGDAAKATFTLKASPPVAFAPARIYFTAELKGGPDDVEDLYCPTVEWNWDDDTVSESQADCDPYEPGKSRIQRRYSTEHRYTVPGVYRVELRLLQKKKSAIAASTTVEIRGGARTFGR